MSDTESDESSKHADGVAARKRYNMKALGQLVDSNRITGVARPTEVSSGPHHRMTNEPDVDDADATEDDEIVDAVDVGEADADAEVAVDDLEPGAAVVEPDEAELRLPDDLADDHGLGALFDEGDPVGHPATSGPEALLEGTAASTRVEHAGGSDGPAVEMVAEVGDVADDAETSVAVDQADDQDETLIELRERGARARRRPPARHDVDVVPEVVPDVVPDDGIDRSELGTQVTRTGLTGAKPARTRDPRESMQPLARHILDEEIQPGGRLSNPRDVPGIVLNLAKDIPAAAAVSVVRIDEEIELVGNTIDPDIEPGVLASMFSGVFRSIQVAAGALAQGPLGTVHDLVIEGEHMDLILRPLGVHYYLMVLEDRRSPHADLAATRMRMAALAPGLSAILAQGDGEA